MRKVVSHCSRVTNACHTTRVMAPDATLTYFVSRSTCGIATSPSARADFVAAALMPGNE